MRILTFIACLVITNVFGQVQPFEVKEENGIKWSYYQLNSSIMSSLEIPIKKTKKIISDISKTKTKNVVTQLPTIYNNSNVDTVLENRIKWASNLISIEGINLDKIYFGIGPEMFYGQQKQKCRMLTFIYDLPSDHADKNYENQIRVTFLELANTLDWNFKGEFKISALTFTRASDQIKLDQLQKVFH